MTQHHRSLASPKKTSYFRNHISISIKCEVINESVSTEQEVLRLCESDGEEAIMDAVCSAGW